MKSWTLAAPGRRLERVAVACRRDGQQGGVVMHRHVRGAPVARAWLQTGFLAAAMAGGWLPAVAQGAIITVGLPGESGCAFTSLQTAINAAAASSGLDILRLSVGTFSAQRLQIMDSGDLAIEGGWLACTLPIPNAGTTTLSGQERTLRVRSLRTPGRGASP
ncbi:hypothetical protein [Tahibacter amnicola]|uniref:Uncharacterized protein n=1 Tax=Tahibacter amnicola TaxID=2976241 RepID=A0ABY6BR21_9GAMM|nr:hypothetical protein [Tahibacter amnicola]UXI70212.1 hypothetical protein N4264_11435 [Tahibacter amnicola]